MMVLNTTPLSDDATGRGVWNVYHEGDDDDMNNLFMESPADRVPALRAELDRLEKRVVNVKRLLANQPRPSRVVPSDDEEPRTREGYSITGAKPMQCCKCKKVLRTIRETCPCDFCDHMTCKPCGNFKSHPDGFLAVCLRLRTVHRILGRHDVDHDTIERQIPWLLAVTRTASGRWWTSANKRSKNQGPRGSSGASSPGNRWQ